MPQLSWIDALRQYNAGMPSWCIPRRGTPAYEMITRIRQGEKPKSFKELTEELERKTGGKPKAEKKSMKIDLGESKEVATVPTIVAEEESKKIAEMSLAEVAKLLQTLNRELVALQRPFSAKLDELKEEGAKAIGTRMSQKARNKLHKELDERGEKIREEKKKAVEAFKAKHRYDAVVKREEDLRKAFYAERDKKKA